LIPAQYCFNAGQPRPLATSHRRPSRGGGVGSPAQLAAQYLSREYKGSDNRQTKRISLRMTLEGLSRRGFPTPEPQELITPGLWGDSFCLLVSKIVRGSIRRCGISLFIFLFCLFVAQGVKRGSGRIVPGLLCGSGGTDRRSDGEPTCGVVATTLFLLFVSKSKKWNGQKQLHQISTCVSLFYHAHAILN